MELTDALQAIFRWLHIAAGVMWIGHLYFFNFVNGPMGAVLDGPTKKVVVPQLMPRALYWFRWGAAWTWITGVLLLMLVFYHGGAVFAAGRGWNFAAVVMVLATFLVAMVYDVLAKADFAKNLQTLGGVGWVLTAAMVLLFIYVGGFGYRGYSIHTGAMFGTIMAMNVWMRIWPAQQKIIAATRDGQPPDAALVALAGTRSRHNTYLSVPLLWTMINYHTTAFANPIALLVMVPLGWALVYWLYTKAGQVKGF
jgi:uncharacterized membrane protein